MFATPAELETLLGETVDNDQATLLLENASALIRGYLRQQVDFVTDGVEEYLGDGNTVILLRELPVVSVASVSVDGDALTADGWTVSPRNGVLYRRGGVWTRFAKVEVTYTHGFDEIPQDIVKATLELARIGVVNRHGVQRISGEDWAITYSMGTPSGAAGPSPVEQGILRSLDHYRVTW